MNPAGKQHTVDKLLKVTLGRIKEDVQKNDQLYNLVITTGTYLTTSIMATKAAKVIENSQRDMNIALTIELAKIFNLLKIDIHKVLNTAATKWNFFYFKLGLVGCRCIGVNPYYLAQKALEGGYYPEIILTG